MLPSSSTRYCNYFNFRSIPQTAIIFFLTQPCYFSRLICLCEGGEGGFPSSVEDARTSRALLRVIITLPAFVNDTREAWWTADVGTRKHRVAKQLQAEKFSPPFLCVTSPFYLPFFHSEICLLWFTALPTHINNKKNNLNIYKWQT